MRRKAGLVKGGTRPPLTFIPIAPVTGDGICLTGVDPGSPAYASIALSF
ncbi:hypothetical protein [Pantoea agglomerans]|nr:hypothetical protein [Pantoea agglomerans]